MIYELDQWIKLKTKISMKSGLAADGDAVIVDGDRRTDDHTEKNETKENKFSRLLRRASCLMRNGC